MASSPPDEANLTQARQIAELERRIEALEKARLGERKARARAEQALREATAKSLFGGGDGDADGNGCGDGQSAPGGFRVRPIGRVRSCFDKRNGTPRQPLLVPDARATLRLEKRLGTDILAGLEQYSHVWLVYIFSENTNVINPNGKVNAKVRVPRLNGASVGVFGTRTPHRPNPIGLSVASISSVDGRDIHLRGADLVNGTPVIDIKPYIPYCDALGAAVTPPWVRTDDGALAVARIDTVDARALEAAFDERWRLYRDAPLSADRGPEDASAKRRYPRPLYDTVGEFTELVRQVLSIDFRSTHKRTGRAQQQQDYNVTLDGINVRYDIRAAPREEGGGTDGADGAEGTFVVSVKGAEAVVHPSSASR